MPGGEELAGGHGNNGMAHGIAGPLAARHDLLVPGQHEAIAIFARWLDRDGGHYWTTRAHLDTNEPPEPEPARQSWCYGRPGIARAQQLAVLALDEPARRQAAEDTVVRTLTDPDHLTRITDATLCHGCAGLVTLARAVAADSPTPERFTPVIGDLRQRRDLGQPRDAEIHFKRSVATRRRQLYARTHSVTLGYLGVVQVQQGRLDEACATWSEALEAMSRVHSGRARDVIVRVQSDLSPVRHRGGRHVTELDRRARDMLRTIG